jgi:ABC-2 type transport system ATP-binding protein
VLLDAAVDELPARFPQLTVAPQHLEQARALNPFYVRELFGRTIMLYQDRPAESLAGLGELRTPGIADLFVAKMQVANLQVANP